MPRGGIELAMQLNLVEGFDLAKMGANSPEALHTLIEAIKVAKADVYKDCRRPEVHARSARSGCAVQVARRVAAEAGFRWTRRSRIRGLAFRAGAAAASANLEAMLRLPAGQRRSRKTTSASIYDTTSFSIVDQYGNAVSATPTLGGGFGAGVVVGNTGLLLNNGIRLRDRRPRILRT